mgnify:CR=1 FL=1
MLDLDLGIESLGRHTVGLSGPAREVLSVESELRLELLDGVGVVQEEDLVFMLATWSGQISLN